MERFCQHIEKLLAHYEYVVVPGLGGFVVQTQSAVILADSIIPPLATIGFNPLMHHADGLLAIEISRSQQISYRQAVEYIDKEVENIHQKIETSGSARLGTLGMFQKDDARNLVFVPIGKAGFLPQNLGLNELHVSERVQTLNKPRHIVLALPSANVFRYAAAVLILFGLFFVTNRVSDVRRTDTASLASLSFLNPPVKPKAPERAVSADTVAIAVATVEQAPSDTCSYHVIVASLPTRESAETFCQSLVDKFPTVHVLEPAKTYRVAIQSFSDRDEAIDYMQKLRLADSEFESAWVYCN